MEPTKLDNASQIISIVDVGLIGENSFQRKHNIKVVLVPSLIILNPQIDELIKLNM